MFCNESSMYGYREAGGRNPLLSLSKRPMFQELLGRLSISAFIHFKFSSDTQMLNHAENRR